MSDKTSVRSPVCVVLGHVDHGKSSLLDTIRGSNIVSTEAGAITQAIGASIIPIHTIQKVCGDFLTAMNIDFTIPGLLFIDTPGHAAFTNLRKRGGNLADIAILVVDINEGFKPQTKEALEILKAYKTPFVVAANKVDLVPGWRSSEDSKGFLQSFEGQADAVKETVEKKIYGLVETLFEMEFQCERFDRIDDYTKQIAIIPTSAKTGEGVSEVLAIISGLAQKYLDKTLKCNVSGFARGTILEVKEEKGLGKTLDVIIYDGCLNVGDTVVIGGIDAPIVTKIRGLFEPKPLTEMRDKKSKFKPVKQVIAATGVKILAPDVDKVIAGMPLLSCEKCNVDSITEQIQNEVKEVLIETDDEGIIVKADTLGSLEAITAVLRGKGVKVLKGGVGSITKKDVSDAESNFEKNPLNSVVLGFNIDDASSLCKDTVKIITADVIYKLIDDFEKWVEDEKKRLEKKELDGVVKPAKVELIKGYVFRQSNPAICGVHVLEGKLRTGTQLMKDGHSLCVIKEIQHEKENLKELEKDKQAAVSMQGVTVGRQINEGDIMYTFIPEDDFKKLKEFKQHLTKEDIVLLKEVAEIMRKNNPVWGV